MKDFSKNAFSGLASKIGMMSFVLLFLSFAFASQANAQIVISEVYGGGGNAGAVRNQDFVELYNNTGAAIDISGYSLQYATAALGNATSTYQVCTISATDTVIEPGTYFLIATGAASTTVGAALPTPNATCTIGLAVGAGKVALVSNSTPLSNASCPTLTAPIIDYVGYGTGASGASCFEGSAAAPTPSATVSDQRNATGSDTNQNGADFTTSAPTPTAGGNGDLTITQSAPASVSSGSNFNYTLTLNNSGSNTNLTGVSVNFTIPTGVTFVSASGGSCATMAVVSGVVQFRGCTIAANTTNLTVTVKVTAAAGDTITSTGANVLVDFLATIPETNEGNNTTTDASTTVTAAPPTAAMVNVGGRVTNSKGRGISGATVMMTDGNGNNYSAVTDSLGNYLFAGIEVGQTLIFNVQAKKVSFTQPSQVISLTEETITVNFTGIGLRRFGT